jgi:putative transposase
LKELQLANVYWRGDERILGEGDFVDEVLRAAEERLARREVLKRQGWDLQRLVREICEMLSGGNLGSSLEISFS